MTNSTISTGDIHAQGSVIVGDNNQIVTNIYLSADWQRLVTQRDELQAAIQESPNVPYLHKKLAEVQQHMEDFKRDVLKLAEEISKIPLNTARLKQAVAYFDAGEYDKARAVLDAAAITQERDALLQRQREVQSQQAEIQQQLDDKAEEFLLKAKLTAIDYSLGDQRIATTSHYFEQALKSGRTPERLFNYAVFLQENNQRKEAETLYTEALDIRRTLAKTNPDVYLPYVATTLNNLGNLVSDDPQRRKEAETLYTEALDIRRTLAKTNPDVYLPDVAMTLNNLGLLVAADTQRRKEAETLFTEALDNYRKLAEANPAVYLPYVATTLNNLGVLVAADTRRRKEAETLYTEALDIRRTLAKADDVYLPYVARTLGGFGYAYLQWGEPQQARIHLQEAAAIMQPLAEQYPNVHGGLYDFIMEILAKTE